jgi:hypothetical protein
MELTFEHCRLYDTYFNHKNCVFLPVKLNSIQGVKLLGFAFFSLNYPKLRGIRTVVHSAGSCHRWNEARSPWIVTPYTCITASIEPADRSSKYNHLHRRSYNPNLHSQVCVSYCTKGTYTLKNVPASRAGRRPRLWCPRCPYSLSPMSGTGLWFRGLRPGPTTMTGPRRPPSQSQSSSFPYRGRARLGW